MGYAHPLLSEEEGRTEFLLGNEAIARGAIEAGVGFACGYPGTPSTEVTDTFSRLAPLMGIPFEYSVNEKIALEMAFAAAISGARSIVAMKHLGLMYAGDPLSTIPYIGVEAGMVIVSAGDPSAHTSPNEQDQRHLADALHIPMFDPRTPQEALEVTRYAFELSERSRLPVIIRPTTRVCHTAAPVTFGPIRPRSPAAFRRAPGRFLPLPPNARKMRVEINDRLRTAREMVDHSGFFFRRGGGTAGVLASGAPAAICEELVDDAVSANRLTFASLATVYPLPEDWLVETLEALEEVLVIEELSPYLEDQLRALCSLHGLQTRVLGKRTGHFPTEFEYEPRLISQVLAETFDIDASLPDVIQTGELPQRAPTLCAACPHRSTFFAARSVFADDALYFNDIGCYTLGVAPPLSVGDALLSMGAGFSLAAGVARTTGARTLGFLGDSTFFHSGMPALLNAIKENVNMVAVIMDNEITAMTGFQETAGTVLSEGKMVHTIDIEAIVRAMGAARVEVIDPNELSVAIGAFERARQAEGLSVIISQRVCPVFGDRALTSTPPVSRSEPGTPSPVKISSNAAPTGVSTYRIDHSRCQHCGRESCGQRCSQGVEVEYERAMAKARSLEVGEQTVRAPVAPCAEKCPLYLCIQGYTAHIAAGRYADALELIMDGLPLADSVCRVCHRPCEDVCVRSDVDQPVAINDLKRFVMDWAATQDEFPYKPNPETSHGLRVAVIGAGPAGLSASHELAMRGYAVTLFDAADEPGGLLRYGIPEYRLPTDALERDVDRILDLGVSFEGGRRLGDEIQVDEILAGYDAMVVAIGGGDDVDIDIPGSGPELIRGLEYLGSETPTPERVIVVGGGNSAIDTSRTALRRGATEVTVICLESRDEMPAISTEIEAAEEEGVRILHNHRVTRLVPEGISAEEVASRVPGSKNPADYEPVGEPELFLAAELLISAIGQRRGTPFFPDDTTPTNGTLKVTPETGQTSHPKIFAAGDMTSTAGHVTDAIGAGIRAAWGLDRYLRGETTADRRMPPPRVSPEPPVGRSGVSRGHTEARRAPVELAAAERIHDFSEVVSALSESEARAEAARCMICGLCGNCNACLDLFGCPAFYVEDSLINIDPNLCTACGVCAQFCPNDAIVPVRGMVPLTVVATGASV